MNKKSYSFDMETFRNMLLICPKLPGQKFIDPPFEEEILTFIRELGYPGNIKLLYDVKVDTLPQPWRTFGTIINKCLSGKVTRIDTLRLSRAQILWGLYHQEKVDYVYLLWEDLTNPFPRINKGKTEHMANDDPILTTMRFIPQHEVVQRYGVILLDYLTNLAMKESEAYKIYHDLTSRNGCNKTKIWKISCKSSDEDDDDEVDVSKHEDDDDDKRIESDNDGEDFVHPKFLTHDVESRQEEVNEEYSFDPMVQTPYYVELANDGNSDEEVQGTNIEEEEMVEEATHEEDEANEL
ncbi:hypothetical protein Tco_0974344 [Tanacetum coccineum]|uniref:Uncharacterized protein n=1 Tax=Tanacetum coccineum TaxID=301880 RepID=A0ABQ5EBE1_9ASTR